MDATRELARTGGSVVSCCWGKEGTSGYLEHGFLRLRQHYLSIV